ncbi:hypothetical protein MTO96_009307 [Rhipicephalus appendiculatus]
MLIAVLSMPLLLVCAAIALIAVWLIRADAELTLLFCEKFGVSPASLQGKVVWITGASSGVGEGCKPFMTDVWSLTIAAKY